MGISDIGDSVNGGGDTINSAYKIRYSFDMYFSTGDGKTIVEPTRVKSFQKHVDFTKCFTPEFTVTAMLKMGDVKVLKDNEQNIICNIKLQKLKYKTPSGVLSEKLEVERTVVFDTIFIPIIEAEDIRSFRDMKTHDDKAEYSTQDRSHNLFEIRFYLNSLSYHLMFKNNFNAVLRGKDDGHIRIDSAIKFICETCGADKYIVDMPDNDMIYNNIIIPPGNVKFTFDILQSMYGVYFKDILTFFDFDDVLYVLSRLNTNHEYQKDAIRTVMISVNSDRENSDPGTVTYFEGNKAGITIFKGLEDQSISIASGEAYGDAIVFTNYGFGDETFMYENGKFLGTNEPTREFVRNTLSHGSTQMGLSFEYDELNNAFNMFSILEILGLHTFYVIKSEGMDVDFLKPNVLYTIHVNSNEPTDNDKYKDKVFPIASYIQDFVRDNDVSTTNIFKSEETIVLADMTKQIKEI